MSDSEEQNDELLVLSEILEPQNFNHTGDQKCIASLGIMTFLFQFPTPASTPER